MPGGPRLVRGPPVLYLGEAGEEVGGKMPFSGATQIGGTSAGANNFRQVWSETTTRLFERDLQFARRMLASWDGDAEMADEVFVQNPNYNIGTRKGIDTKSGSSTNLLKRAAWGTPNEPSASRITIAMNRNYRAENMLYVEDELVNAVRDYRARLEGLAIHSMAMDFEDDIIAYMQGLTASNKAVDNGNAGGIVADAKGVATAKAGTGFSITTGRPTSDTAGTTADQVRGWPLEALEDGQVRFQRANLNMPGFTIGGMVGRPWAIMPPEIYAFGLAKELESVGFSLDFLREVIQNTGVFGVTWGGNWKGFDLYVSNGLTRPTDDTAAGASNLWYMYLGHDAAIAAPRRRMRNYVRMPENATAERYEFRHVTNAGIQLINSEGLTRVSLQASN